MKKTKKGFTLVELLVVIAILAILASVVVVGYTAFVNKARDAKAQEELNLIVKYINIEFMDDGKWDYNNGASLDKNTITTTTLRAAIATVEEFNDYKGEIEVSTSGNVITITYTLADGGTASATLD